MYYAIKELLVYDLLNSDRKDTLSLFVMHSGYSGLHSIKSHQLGSSTMLERLDICTTYYKDSYFNIKHGIHYIATRIQKLLANINPLPAQINYKRHPNSYTSTVCPEDLRSLMRMRFLCFGLLAGRELYLSGSRCDHSGIALICCHMYFSSLLADFA